MSEIHSGHYSNEFQNNSFDVNQNISKEIEEIFGSVEHGKVKSFEDMLSAAIDKTMEAQQAESVLDNNKKRPDGFYNYI